MGRWPHVGTSTPLFARGLTLVIASLLVFQATAQAPASVRAAEPSAAPTASADPDPSPPPVDHAAAAQATARTVAATNDQWKTLELYWAGGITNPEPSGWQSVGFDDAGWSAADIVTAAAHWYWVDIPGAGFLTGTGHATGHVANEIWIARYEFGLAGQPDSDSTLTWNVDDWGSIWINGEPVVTEAGDWHQGYMTTIPRGLLHAGTNSIAVKVFQGQDTPSNNDWNHNPTMFQARLDVDVPPPPPNRFLGPGDNLHQKDQTGTYAEPVNTYSGNFTNVVTDLSLPGRGLPFAFTRTYNSVQAAVDGPLGPGWSHPYGASLLLNADGSISFVSEDGSTIPFGPDGRGGYAGIDGVLSTLAPATGGGYTLSRHDGVRYGFDATGRLGSETDRNGNSLTFGYTGGDLTLITDTVGRTTTVTVNAAHHITGLHDPIGRTVTYGYDASDRLASVTDLRGRITTYGYDAAGRLATVTDPNSHVLVTNTYDDSDRVIEQVDARGFHTTFVYDEATGTTTMTDPRGGAWVDAYDRGALVARRDPLGNTTQYAYDAQYNMTSVTDARSNTTTFTYDTAGNQLSRSVPSPLWILETWTYNTLNEPLTFRDGRYSTTTMTYDTVGNLLTTTGPGPISPVTTYTYDANGLLATATDPRGKTSTLGYDAQANLNRTTSPLDEVTTMTYDGAGRLRSSIDPRGNVAGADPALYTTTYGYDDADHLASLTDALGHTTSYTYDPAGNRTSVTDANNHTTTYTYDEANHLASVTDAAEKTTAYAYDETGNMVSRTDPDNHTTTWTHDLANRVTTETDPLDHVSLIGYDAAGNPTARTDANDKTTTFAYDAVNRLTSITYADSSTHPVTFTYDPNGNRLSMTDGGAASSGWDTGIDTETYSYDELDRMTAAIRGKAISQYSYDAAGNVLTRSYPPECRIPFICHGIYVAPEVTTYTYDDDGRMATASDPDVHGSGPIDYTAPTVPTGLTATAGGSARVDLAWTASTDDIGVTGYKLYRNNVYQTAIGVIGSTAISDTGLAANTTYTYKVNAIDGTGKESALSVAAVAKTAISTDSVAPSVPTGVSATATAWNSVTLTWTASTDNVGVTRYAIFRAGVALAVAAGSVTSFTDRTTLPSTTYAYTVKASDAAGRISAASSAANMTTLTCTTCTTVTLRPTSDVSATGFTPVPAGTRYGQLDETTSDGDSSYIGGGTTGTGNAVFGMGGPAGTAFAVTIHYVARQFTTGATGTMNVHAELWNGTALLKTGATHNLTTAYLTYTDTFTLLNVPAAALRVRIVQTSGNTLTITSRFTYLDAVTTYFPTDTVAPTVPTGLTATANGSARVDLAWTASTDAVGVKGYKLYRNNAYLSAIGVVGSTSISDTGLAGNTTYTYKVSAIDAAGKESAQSVAAPATTAISNDTVAPSVPTNVTATATAWNSVTLTWTASTDNVGVTRYAILLFGTPLVVVGGSVTSFTQSTAPSSSYSYTVKAIDAAGKTSAASSAASVTTPARPADATATYTYDPAGNLLTETTPDGITSRLAYDRGGRLIDVANVTAQATLSRSSYALDPAGNPTVMTTTRGSQYFTYDILNRLTGVCYTASCAGGRLPVACIGCVGSPISTPAATITPNVADTFTNWTYDAIGNRLTETNYMGTSTYAYDAADRLTSRTPPGAPAIAYSYDNNGNQTGAGFNVFTYDLADHLIAATVGATTEIYSYAGDGVRLSARTGTSTGSGRQFVVDRNYGLPQVVEERDWAGNGVNGIIAHYVYGLRRISRGGNTFYHYDGLGSVTDLMAGSGPFAWTEYQPFGAVRSAGGTASNPYGFAGEYRDSATGLYHLRARQYDPTTGRFLSTDPVAAGLGDPFVNAYAYVSGNPIRFVDPSGRESQPAGPTPRPGPPPLIPPPPAPKKPAQAPVFVFPWFDAIFNAIGDALNARVFGCKAGEAGFGIGQAFAGAFLEAGSGLAEAVSAGTASPIVVATVAAGMANMIEGKLHVDAACAPTSPFSP